MIFTFEALKEHIFLVAPASNIREGKIYPWGKTYLTTSAEDAIQLWIGDLDAQDASNSLLREGEIVVGYFVAKWNDGGSKRLEDGHWEKGHWYAANDAPATDGGTL